MRNASLTTLDELLTRLRLAQQRPGWRRRVLGSDSPTGSLVELRVLRAVETPGTDGDGPSVRDVADRMGVEHSTASRAVTRAIDDGMLVRETSSVDQRACQLRLTGPGRELLKQTTAQRRKVVGSALADWTDADLRDLTGLLDRLAGALEAAGDA